MLTQIYRFGKTLMPTNIEVSAPPKSASPTDNTTELKLSPQTAAQPSNSASPDGGDVAASPDKIAATVEKGDEEAQSAGKRNGATGARRTRSRKSARRYARRTPAPLTRVSGHDGRVTILADEPERGRILALAKVVKNPPMAVVRASDGIDACTLKPADFVVDTLQNPARLGPAIPLFSESLVIVARDVSDIRKLRDAHVSFGMPGGSSERVAQRLFRSLGINVRNIPLDSDNALDALASGDLDAVALLVPRGYDPLPKHGPQLHLISLDEKTLPPEGLKVSRIDPASYLGRSWPSTALSVVTVDAVLSPNPKATRQRPAMSIYAALDRKAAALAHDGFDLIGGDAVVTMRSVARDDEPVHQRPSPARDGPIRDGC